MTTYKGTAPDYVTADGKNLDPRFDLMNHSPDGFSWGYEGSGPSQLALAILAHHLDDHLALKHYQAFKRDVLAGIPGTNDWLFDSELIDQWGQDEGILAKPPTPSIDEIVLSLYAASQALKIAGRKMATRVEEDGAEGLTAGHPQARNLALLIAAANAVEKVIEALDVRLTDPKEAS